MFKLLRSNQSEIEVTVSNRTVIRVLALVIASFIGLAAVRQASHALTLLFIAFFLALALNAPVHWLAQRLPGKRRGNRTTATALSFVVVIAVLVAFLASIVPPLIRQTSSFLADAPEFIQSARQDDSAVGSLIRRYRLESQIDSLSTDISSRLGNLTGTALSTISRVTSSLIAVITVLVLTFMMLIEGPRWLALARRLTPEDMQSDGAMLARDMYRVIKGYVNGQVVLAAIAAIFIVVPLFILNVPYPVALMVIVFICGLIPMVGHTIGAILVSSIALFESPVAALVILAYYFLYQQIENYAIQPRIQANATNMSPLLVFSAVVIGVSFNGLLGGLVAIPVAGCLRIAVLYYLEKKHLIAAPQSLKTAGRTHTT